MQMKDTYGEDPVRATEGYVDRAAGRLVCVRACVCVHVCMRACVCVCVCVSEREREREGKMYTQARSHTHATDHYLPSAISRSPRKYNSLPVHLYPGISNSYQPI